MATLISIDHNSPEAVSFDNWVNLGAPDPAVQAPVIAMPDFAAMRAGFDRPVERTPALGAYANPDPNEFEKRMEGFKFDGVAHWGAPVKPAAPAAVSNNTVGAIADGVANSIGDMAASLSDVFGGSPKKLQVSEPTNSQVEMGGLTSAADAFGGLSRAERYKQEVLQVQKKPGSNYE
jgi:hypothetical protein